MIDQEEERPEKRETIGQAFLRNLLAGADQTQLKAFVKAVNQVPVKGDPIDKKKANGLVIKYTTVIKKHTCLICGSTYTSTYHMQKGDQLSTIDREGGCHLITMTGKEGEIEIPSTVSKCEGCYTLAKSWDREQLEHNFILLLSQMTFKEKVNYAKAKTIIRKEGEIRI